MRSEPFATYRLEKWGKINKMDWGETCKLCGQLRECGVLGSNNTVQGERNDQLFQIAATLGLVKRENWSWNPSYSCIV